MKCTCRNLLLMLMPLALIGSLCAAAYMMSRYAKGAMAEKDETSDDEATTAPVEEEGIAVDPVVNLAQNLPSAWADVEKEEAMWRVVKKSIDAINAMPCGEERRKATAACLDVVLSLDVKKQNPNTSPRRSLFRECMSTICGSTKADILFRWECRLKYYEFLKRESARFPHRELPSLVDALRPQVRNLPTALRNDATPEGRERRKKATWDIVRAEQKRRAWIYYGDYIRDRMAEMERDDFGLPLKVDCNELSPESRTNLMERVRAAIGRYPDWYKPR